MLKFNKHEQLFSTHFFPIAIFYFNLTALVRHSMRPTVQYSFPHHIIQVLVPKQYTVPYTVPTVLYV
jgi:hypothetical protein